VFIQDTLYVNRGRTGVLKPSKAHFDRKENTWEKERGKTNGKRKIHRY